MGVCEFLGVWVACSLIIELVGVSNLAALDLASNCLNLRRRSSQHLALVVGDLDLDFVDVIFKIAFLACSIWENHPTIAVLNASNPFALVATTISPIHLTVAIAFILFVLALVDVTRSPLELSISALPIIDIVALITIRLGSSTTSPFAFAVLETVFKVTNVDRSI